jgi:hypothetical protein
MTMLIILALYNALLLVFLIRAVLDGIDNKDAALAAAGVLFAAGSFATTFYFLTEILS